MNEKFKAAVWECLDGLDSSDLADIFNIFASDYDNLEFYLRKDEVYVFNILDNKQAAHAVAKFGFEAIEKASKDDWIIYAQKSDNKDWEFISKSPRVAISEHLESVICDIISRPKEYPSWVIEQVAPIVCNLAIGLYD